MHVRRISMHPAAAAAAAAEHQHEALNENRRKAPQNGDDIVALDVLPFVVAYLVTLRKRNPLVELDNKVTICNATSGWQLAGKNIQELVEWTKQGTMPQSCIDSSTGINIVPLFKTKDNTSVSFFVQ
jgi:hypothetical protein